MKMRRLFVGRFNDFFMEDNKMAERSCTTCEFNNYVVCMGSGRRTDNGENTYGMPIEEAMEMFPNGCEDYGISLLDFIDDEIKAGR